MSSWADSSIQRLQFSVSLPLFGIKCRIKTKSIRFNTKQTIKKNVSLSNSRISFICTEFDEQRQNGLGCPNHRTQYISPMWALLSVSLFKYLNKNWMCLSLRKQKHLVPKCRSVSWHIYCPMQVSIYIWSVISQIIISHNKLTNVLERWQHLKNCNLKKCQERTHFTTAIDNGNDIDLVDVVTWIFLKLSVCSLFTRTFNESELMTIWIVLLAIISNFIVNLFTYS